MKKVLRNLIAFTLIISAISADAQNSMRYLDDVFTNVTVTSDVEFAANISILPVVLSGGVNPPALTPIMCDIYEPTGDNLTERPVVILVHTGSFLPQVINGLRTTSLPVDFPLSIVPLISCPNIRGGILLLSSPW